jgi:hypothetical protein
MAHAPFERQIPPRFRLTSIAYSIIVRGTLHTEEYILERCSETSY